MLRRFIASKLFRICLEQLQSLLVLAQMLKTDRLVEFKLPDCRPVRKSQACLTIAEGCFIVPALISAMARWLYTEVPAFPDWISSV